MIVEYRIHMMNGDVHHVEGELIRNGDLANCKWLLIRKSTPDWSKIEYINAVNISHIEVLADNGERTAGGMKAVIEEMIE